MTFSYGKTVFIPVGQYLFFRKKTPDDRGTIGCRTHDASWGIVYVQEKGPPCTLSIIQQEPKRISKEKLKFD